jgi:hypothetical protein
MKDITLQIIESLADSQDPLLKKEFSIFGT